MAVKYSKSNNRQKELLTGPSREIPGPSAEQSRALNNFWEKICETFLCPQKMTNFPKIFEAHHHACIKSDADLFLLVRLFKTLTDNTTRNAFFTAPPSSPHQRPHSVDSVASYRSPGPGHLTLITSGPLSAGLVTGDFKGNFKTARSKLNLAKMKENTLYVPWKNYVKDVR